MNQKATPPPEFGSGGGATERSRGKEGGPSSGLAPTMPTSASQGQAMVPQRALVVGGVEHLVRVGDAARALKSGGPTRRFMPPSKLAALVGADRYAGPHDLFLLVARDISEAAGEPAEWGKILEPVVGKRWVERFDGGNFDRWRRGQARTVGDWLKLYPDWETVGEARIQVLEAKTCSAWRVSDWEGGVPLYYQCQVQPYLRVIGAEACHVGLLVGGQQLRSYIVERDDGLADAILETAWDFWRDHVLTGVPPPIDGSRAARRAIAELYPRAAKNVRPALPHEVDLMEDLARTKTAIAAAEGRKTLIENLILETIGTGYGLTGPLGKVLAVDFDGRKSTSWADVVKELRASITVDQQFLLEVIERHTKPTEPRRDLRAYLKGFDNDE